MGNVIHKTTRVKVWTDVDEGIADMVIYLNTIDGVTTWASCQGTIGEGGPEPYPPHVMAGWSKEVEPRLLEEFDIIFEGECWGCLYPKKGWKVPSNNATDAQKFVLAHSPAATVSGPTPRGKYLLFLSHVSSSIFSSGITEIEAWSNAANKILKEK